MTPRGLDGWTDWNAGLKARVLTPADRAYRLTILPPPDAPPPGGWPILWILDADQHGLTMMETLRRLLGRPGKTRVRPMLAVGIQSLEAADDPARRHRDFTAGPARTEDRPGPTGGAAAFLDLLTGPFAQDVQGTGLAAAIPPAIWGHSLAAYFALWATSHRSAAFTACAAISPSLWWDEAALACPSPQTPATFLVVGSREVDEPGSDRRMIDRVRCFQHRSIGSGAQCRLAILDDEDHASVVSATAAASLRYLSHTFDTLGIIRSVSSP